MSTFEYHDCQDNLVISKGKNRDSEETTEFNNQLYKNQFDDNESFSTTADVQCNICQQYFGQNQELINHFMQYHVITQTPELEARNKTPFLDPENKTDCHLKTKSSENQAPPRKEETQLIYVNSKQYHRIMVRRLARAKLLASGRISDKRSKFLHQSRSEHALNRYRGVGGKFYSV